MGSGTRNIGKSRAPKDSVLFERIVPVLLILMGVLTALLILFAAGVLLGFIHF
jgi:hypothetical protein